MKLLKSWRSVKCLISGVEPRVSAQAQPKIGCTLPIKLKRLIYSNIIVKYSIKAVNWPCCAQPTYKSSYMDWFSECFSVTIQSGWLSSNGVWLMRMLLYNSFSYWLGTFCISQPGCYSNVLVIALLLVLVVV